MKHTKQNMCEKEECSGQFLGKKGDGEWLKRDNKESDDLYEKAKIRRVVNTK